MLPTLALTNSRSVIFHDTIKIRAPCAEAKFKVLPEERALSYSYSEHLLLEQIGVVVTIPQSK